MEQCCGHLQWKLFLEITAISAPILPRERELSLAHAQRSNYLIMEHRSGPLAEDIVPRKHCDFSTYLPKRERAPSGACADVKFPHYGTVLWSTDIRDDSREALQFQYLFTKRTRAQSGTCAEVNFADYGTVLWSPGSRNFSRKAKKHCDFRTYLAKRASAWSGACAGVQIPDYGTELWSPISRSRSWETMRFQHLYLQESVSLVWRWGRFALS
jgi:hypothetical protein